MSLFQQFQSKQAGKPMWLAVSCIGFTFSLYGFYRYGYKPWSRRRRYNEAEGYAQIIFDKENESQANNEHFE